MSRRSRKWLAAALLTLLLVGGSLYLLGKRAQRPDQMEILNVNGGAIALGHPLGCTGTKLTVQLIDEMKRRGNKYGMVTMCVGTGQGAASIFEIM